MPLIGTLEARPSQFKAYVDASELPKEIAMQLTNEKTIQ